MDIVTDKETRSRDSKFNLFVGIHSFWTGPWLIRVRGMLG